MGCTGSHLNAMAVDSISGIGGQSADIDEAAMQAIKSGIGAGEKMTLK